VRRIPALGFAFLLAACAGGGPSFEQHIAAQPEVARASARLTVYRTADHPAFFGRAVAVKLDGRELGTCDYAAFRTFYVPTGDHVLGVELWDVPGTCRLSVGLMGGEDYFFEIAPRQELVLSSLLGSLLGGTGLRGIGIGLGSTAIGADAGGTACGGAFSIVGVEETAARARLKALPLSR